MKTMKESWTNSYLFGMNASFVEDMYETYLEHPELLDKKWKNYFDSLQNSDKPDLPHSVVKEKIIQLTQKPGMYLDVSGNIDSVAQFNVVKLIDAYRTTGLNYADLDPLKLEKDNAYNISTDTLDLSLYGLSNELESEFIADIGISNKSTLKLKDIITKLCQIYCGNIGFDFSAITNLAEKEWLYKYVETKYLDYKLNNTEKTQVLQKLTEAEGLERYLNTKYVGQKRFSIEGGESLLPAIDRLIRMASKSGVKEVVIGMAHRGRLNSLVNITGKPPKKLFDEFDGNYVNAEFVTTGDVKYHKGYKCNYITEFGKVKTIIAYNPSHLEIVNPVINGIVRASQDKSQDQSSSVMGLLIHGDSALIGLGTNQGVFTMSQTEAYAVGGMIHVVVNNQIGFTTSEISNARSSPYCTDIAKMTGSPIIHINSGDLESVMFAIDLAVEYRAQFKKDIMLDIVCFRKHGHNEADDPTLTQPMMYKKIKEHPGIRKLYGDKLVKDGVMLQDEVDNMFENYRVGLTQGVHIKAETMEPLDWYEDFDTKSVLKDVVIDKVKTAIDAKKIAIITDVTTKNSDNDFKLHPTLAKLLENRNAMGHGKQPIDYGMAEILAYGSLLQDGVSVRISGEDSRRGTFSHRQVVWHNANLDTQSTNKTYTPLLQLKKNNNKFNIYDSVLNEECVLGFEYGYSIKNLNDLVIWEAQFGDFANGAQVIIDQFIASGEAKWGQLSNLTMILPHGYDGQGPEHSSARIERFLQLCAENNMQIVIPSTAAQMFHILRYKGLTKLIKPLVIFMSKRLLRAKNATSEITEITDGKFNVVLGDNRITSKDIAKNIDKVIVCTGQVYYDLVDERIKLKLEDKVAIIRLEQLYPFPAEALAIELSKYVNATKFVWVQEEPYNQGSWLQIRDNLNSVLGGLNSVSEKECNFRVVSRDTAAAPACGKTKDHNEQLKLLLESAFKDCIK